ncbi:MULTISPECIES: PKD domain-containing protein [unclassified Massilia]|uniref:PKD domain-containing protein n=1 Tax=unclassified Massilia TaxID=2609279 RepID=UPI0017853759|nr:MULTISPECIES: PKD domain-containing protein [unclassified Massilia]MBD8528483.1 PKD domain-containing protein [Massilia sp. CFBP 13647]MBD8671894.1 PKD domain-containing protein [Massilia sp. CFBP 13721]
MTRANPDGSETELAYRWSNFSPVNLNTRLLDAPAGLVLTQALHIAPSGDIVANSNAGLVLLRQGRAGTDAPVLGPVALGEPIRPTVATTLTQTFSDRNPRDTHSATVDWGDGSGPQPAIVDETRGRGSISATHTYAGAGDFTIVVNVTDSTGRTTSTFRLVTVEPPRPFGAAENAAAAVQPTRSLLGPETPAAVQARLKGLPKK